MGRSGSPELKRRTRSRFQLRTWLQTTRAKSVTDGDGSTTRIPDSKKSEDR